MWEAHKGAWAGQWESLLGGTLHNITAPISDVCAAPLLWHPFLSCGVVQACLRCGHTCTTLSYAGMPPVWAHMHHPVLCRHAPSVGTHLECCDEGLTPNLTDPNPNASPDSYIRAATMWLPEDSTQCTHALVDVVECMQYPGLVAASRYPMMPRDPGLVPDDTTCR